MRYWYCCYSSDSLRGSSVTLGTMQIILALVLVIFRGNHVSNTTSVTHGFFKLGEQRSKV